MEIEKNFDINTELSADQRKELCRVILKHKHIFVTNLSEIKTLKFEPYKIVLKPNAVPVSCPPYNIPYDADKWLLEALSQLESYGMIERSNSSWDAGTVLFPADINKRHKRKKKASS